MKNVFLKVMLTVYQYKICTDQKCTVQFGSVQVLYLSPAWIREKICAVTPYIYRQMQSVNKRPSRANFCGDIHFHSAQALFKLSSGADILWPRHALLRYERLHINRANVRGEGTSALEATLKWNANRSNFP